MSLLPIASRMLNVFRVVLTSDEFPCTVLTPSKSSRGQCAANKIANASYFVPQCQPYSFNFGPMLRCNIHHVLQTVSEYRD